MATSPSVVVPRGNTNAAVIADLVNNEKPEYTPPALPVLATTAAHDLRDDLEAEIAALEAEQAAEDLFRQVSGAATASGAELEVRASQLQAHAAQLRDQLAAERAEHVALTETHRAQLVEAHQAYGMPPDVSRKASV
jgi:hypothetical protein